jgi:23S rRNA pseudouridine1911/1915/1917 synthase
VIGRNRNLSHERDEISLIVRSELAPRLDRYILDNLPWRSRNRVQRLIRGGSVRVNGLVSKPSRRVRPGDTITVVLSGGHGVPDDYDDRELPILWEDPWLLVLDKPAGLLVHPVGRHVYDTLLNYLHHRYHGRVEDGRVVEPRLCHRLDKDTTGILVVAKNAWAHREVSAQFENRRVRKSYVALVEGEFPDAERRIELPIGEGRSLEEALGDPARKNSTTEVRRLHALRGFTLLGASPHTGRQNQIRVHLAAIGFPIVGDTRYGGISTPPGFPDRYLLHAATIELWHPGMRCALSLSAPLPADFSALIEESARERVPGPGHCETKLSTSGATLEPFATEIG